MCIADLVEHLVTVTALRVVDARIFFGVEFVRRVLLVGAVGEFVLLKLVLTFSHCAIPPGERISDGLTLGALLQERCIFVNFSASCVRTVMVAVCRPRRMSLALDAVVPRSRPHQCIQQRVAIAMQSNHGLALEIHLQQSMAWALVQLILNRLGLSCSHRRLWLEKVAGQVGRGCFDAPQCFVTLV